VTNKHKFEDSKYLYQQATKDAKAMNTQIEWNKTANLSPYELSVQLLTKILSIYKDNVGLINKFGLMAMASLAVSDEFNEFCFLGCELQKANLKDLQEQQKLPFWINMYNVILLHSYVGLKMPLSPMQRITFFKKGSYQIGVHSFNLMQIEHSILRGNLSRPDTVGSKLLPKYNKKDDMFELVVEAEPLVNFALSAGTLSSPPIRVYSDVNTKEQLTANAKEFLATRVTIRTEKKDHIITVPKILQWYSEDFGGNDKSLIEKIVDLLPEEQKQQVKTILSSAAHLKVKADEYQWEFLYPVSEG